MRSVGGYFGGRLLEAAQDVTFLVRARRAAELATAGLVIQSRSGDVSVSNLATIVAENLHERSDLVLLACKAYNLEGAISSFAPAVGPDTAILPLLNGMRHLDILDRRFGAGHVLGGQCLISVTLNERGEIVHLNETHNLSFGERDGARSARVQAIASVLSSGNFQSRLSEAILEEMQEKWIFISTNAGITCLMRAAVGDIVAGGAADLAIRLLDECTTIATQQGFPPSSRFIELNRAVFTSAGSGLTASMLRDIERGAPIEADHIVGDLLRRGDENASPLVRLAYAHLKAYEARRAREMTLSGKACLKDTHLDREGGFK